MTVVLPPYRVAIAGNAPPSREWYRFFQDSLKVNLDVDSLQERVDDLTVRVTALEDAPASSTPTRITGYGSIYVSATAIKTVTLYGDAEDPGFTTYYGTDTTGEKGWYAVAATLADSSNVVKSTDSDGVTSFDLTDVTVASTGGTLKKRSFDGKGRLSAEASATTTDLTEGDNLYFTDARADARITAQKGQPNGLATLDSSSKLDPGQLPALAITETFVVNTEAAMLAIDAQEGDVAVRTDLSKSFILTADPPSTLSNWQELLTPTSPVTSVFGRTGSVTAASGDYTPAQVGAEPAFAAGTTAQYRRGDKSWQTLNKAAVGLGNVDNTSDADKPVSTAQATAIGARALDSAVMHLTTGDSSHVTSAKYFDGGLVVGAPADFWVYGAPTGSGKSFWGSEGYFGTNGSFAMSFRSNGYRNASTTWTSLARGGNAGASGIDMLPTGVLKFGADSAAPTGFDTTWRWQMTTASLQPVTDNIYTFGDASHRPSVIWAGTGTISTSDGREKTAVAPLTAAEIAAAGDMSRAIGTYQWLAMVVEKGADAARHHVGLTVQRAIEIMQAHGLDPMRYGFICYDQWGELPEVRDPETDEVMQEYRAAGDRYSFRTDELLLFIARGVDARLSAIEAKLS